MGKTLIGVAVLTVLESHRLLAAPCAASPTQLCLNSSRFQVAVHWQDSRGRSGDGQAVSLTADTGYFWFFSASNVELVVKVLDARSVNGKYWVFFGALSSVQYDLTVTDTATGAIKTYHNPLGQFASVGDTGAFAGSVDAPPSQETALTAGTLAPPESIAAVQRFIDAAPARAENDLSPCPHLETVLRLNGCRFALQADWRDAHGREGRATAVQITNDTGYFWFFSPSNVELVIKVLDARTINGNHWVFYGALSSVQYTLTVTDTLTGAIRSYSNPSGTFASVGDTSAFHAGRSVAAVSDAGREVFANVDSSGGSLSATGADGTRYVLELPPDALGSETTVHLIPLARVDGLPLAGGFVGGVQLKPDGLRLLVPATLRIRPPHTPSRNAVAFSYHAAGEDFALNTSETSGGEISMHVFHFSGAGAGTAGSGDVGGATTPLDTISYIRQLVLQIVDRAQSHEDENGNELPPEITLEERHQLLIALFTDTLNNVIIPRLHDVLPACNRQKMQEAIALAIGCVREIQFLTDVDQEPEIQGVIAEVMAQLVKILQDCLTKSHDDCVRYHDPFQAVVMLGIVRQLQLLGVEGLPNLFTPGGPMESCLRFNLEFDSTAWDSDEHSGIRFGRHVIASKVPLRLDESQSIKDVAWSGGGPLNWAGAIDVTWPVCTLISTQGGPGYFTVSLAHLIPLAAGGMWYLGEIFEPDAVHPIVQYQAASPEDSFSEKCGEDPPLPLEPMGPYWLVDYSDDHRAEILVENPLTFEIHDWDVYGISIFARRDYPAAPHDAGGLTLWDTTSVVITHTPDAPD
jgi:hypothetical protein